MPAVEGVTAAAEGSSQCQESPPALKAEDKNFEQWRLLILSEMEARFEARLQQKEEIFKRHIVQKLADKHQHIEGFLNTLQERQRVLDENNRQLESAIGQVVKSFEGVLGQIKTSIKDVSLRCDAAGLAALEQPSRRSPAATSTATPSTGDRGGCGWSADRSQPAVLVGASPQVQMWHHPRSVGECPTGTIAALSSTSQGAVSFSGMEEEVPTDPVARAAASFHTPTRPVAGGVSGSFNLAGVLPPPMPSSAASSSSARPAVLSLNSALHQESLESAASPTAAAAAIPGVAASPADVDVGTSQAQWLKATAASPAMLIVSVVKKAGETLGLVVENEECFLCVRDISEDSPVARFNASQEIPALRVAVGDRIVGVNGVTGNTELMMQECRSQSLRFSILRDVPGERDYVLGSPVSFGGPSAAAAAAVEASPLSAWRLPGLRADAAEFVPSGPPPGLRAAPSAAASAQASEGAGCRPSSAGASGHQQPQQVEEAAVRRLFE